MDEFKTMKRNEIDCCRWLQRDGSKGQGSFRLFVPLEDAVSSYSLVNTWLDQKLKEKRRRAGNGA